MDGVIADWGAEYDASLAIFGEAAAAIPRHGEQRSFNLYEGRSESEKAIIEAVMVEAGFYSRLRPIEGAREVLKSLVKLGHDVRLVTSPYISNPTCASDKLNWVADHYGSHWAARVVITTDKTVVSGDVLIDDKPRVTGSATPTWEHVLFDQPYNRHIEDRRRISAWTTAEELLEAIA